MIFIDNFKTQNTGCPVDAKFNALNEEPNDAIVVVDSGRFDFISGENDKKIKRPRILYMNDQSAFKKSEFTYYRHNNPIVQHYYVPMSPYYYLWGKK
jgi:hypothetical protein